MIRGLGDNGSDLGVLSPTDYAALIGSSPLDASLNTMNTPGLNTSYATPASTPVASSSPNLLPIVVLAGGVFLLLALMGGKR